MGRRSAEAGRPGRMVRHGRPGRRGRWIAAFDEETRDVIEKFDFDAQIGRLDRAKLLYLVLAKVTEVDLHPDAVSNVEMGYLYEELIRRFSERPTAL